MMRLLRSQMLEVLRQDFVRTAWAKGLRERTVILRHALKNAMIPVLTLIALLVGTLFSGEIVLEMMFGIPGMGLYAVHSIKQSDFPTAQGIVLIVALALVFTNLAVDLTYGWLDPRVRYR
jgi:peptide/nickel transport system permease protein